MNTILELVRRLALIAIFAAFCELLLPSSRFRAYIRMVVGLLVIAMVLQPILELKGSGFDLEGLMGMANLTAIRGDVQDSGWLQEQTKDYVEQQLAAQVRDFLSSDYPGHQVSVKLDVSFDQYGNLSEYRGLEVELRPGIQGIKPVQPVSIGEETTVTRRPGSTALVNGLARHLGLTASTISVWVYTDGGDADGH